MIYDSVGPGHIDSYSESQSIECHTNSLGMTGSDAVVDRRMDPLTTVVTVPHYVSNGIECKENIPCTKCTLSIPSQFISATGNLDITLKFKGEVIVPSGRANNATTTPAAFVDIVLVQIVLIQGEFSADCCLNMRTVLVHTVIGYGDEANAALMESTALSRGYSTRRLCYIAFYRWISF